MIIWYVLLLFFVFYFQWFSILPGFCNHRIERLYIWRCIFRIFGSSHVVWRHNTRSAESLFRSLVWSMSTAHIESHYTCVSLLKRRILWLWFHQFKRFSKKQTQKPCVTSQILGKKGTKSIVFSLNDDKIILKILEGRDINTSWMVWYWLIRSF